MDEERKTVRGESDAAERIDGVAASSCDESKTAGDLAGGGEASGAATPSTARSASPLPSPSPTPTFSGTNRPARRARRLRWQAGVPASMTALALFSFTLLVGGVAGYVSTIPGLLYEPPVPSLVPLGLAFASTDDAAKLSVVSSDGPSRNVGPVDQQEIAEQNAVSAALGLGVFGGVLGAGSLAAGSPSGAVDASFAKAVEASKTPSSSAASNAGSNSGSSASSGSGSGAAGGGGSGATGGDSTAGGSSSGGSASGGSSETPTPSGPSEAEEAQVHALLVDHLNRVNTYVSRLNAAIGSFGSDALHGSLDVRQADYDECSAIDSQTLTDFLMLRNYDCPEGSRWTDQKGNLQRAYIALDQALTPYYDAWNLNLAYANPADGYNRWMEPIWNDQDANGNSLTAAQLNEVLASISL
ncbi:hypothetical protein [uncultured Senegalimassilia sp.]|uniref:hypothetical protein n=1 Tax=uncultured Senegalimassilia sp. TaxID=1714350 RepID=UPI0026711D88|nr:hypothetical protein [uncultured Senegalimassilia sp.]